MSLSPISDHRQLVALRGALTAKEYEINKATEENGEHQKLDVVKTALELVNKMEQQLSLETENRTEISLVNFDEENTSVKKAFMVLLDHLFSEISNVRSASYTFFGLVRKPPSSIDFLSNELTLKLSKDGLYTNWMTVEIRKGNEDALKTWNVLIRMMGKAIHQPGSGVQVQS